MLDHIDLTNVLYLDIETVSGQATFGALSPEWQALWAHKAKSVAKTDPEQSDEEALAASYTDRAAIFAEFGKIICISVGLMYRDKDDRLLKIRLKSFANREEKILLQEFSDMLSQYYNNPDRHYLCGHNIKEFDIPYICRRMLVNGLPLPRLLDISGKKPWETKHLLDTMEMWSFGDRKAFTSLKLLAATLGFPSPKDDIDGSQVGRVFWDDDDLERIAVYCEKDVLATAQLFLRYQLKPILTEEQIHFVKG